MASQLIHLNLWIGAVFWLVFSASSPLAAGWLGKPEIIGFLILAGADTVKNNTWQLQEAKNKFSRLVDNATHGKPQFVTKHGVNAVVILSFDDYNAMTKPGMDLVSFLRESPLMGLELDLSRSKDMPREFDL